MMSEAFENYGTDGNNIKHLEECPGCSLCDYLIEFYQSCDNCGTWGHKDVIGGAVKDGQACVLCSECLPLYDEGKIPWPLS